MEILELKFLRGIKFLGEGGGAGQTLPQSACIIMLLCICSMRKTHFFTATSNLRVGADTDSGGGSIEGSHVAGGAYCL